MNDEPSRVLRGGGWDYQPSSARVALRFGGAPGYRGNLLGVRLVRLVNFLQRLGEMNEV